MACNITKLPSGSVVFEDVSPEIMRGQVLKPLERGSLVRVAQNDPLPGRIRYRAADHSEVEVHIHTLIVCHYVKHSVLSILRKTFVPDSLKKITKVILSESLLKLCRVLS